MKVCVRCNVERPLTKFNFESRGKRLKDICTPCLVEKNREWRAANREAYNEKAAIRRHERKQRMIEYMGGKCVDCEQTYHWCAMDFHHIDSSTKHRDPGLLMGRTDEFLKEELDKCVLLCANCHRIRHFNEGY